MPLISVVMPVFNEEKYLRECLDGLVNQTFSDIEIICVDDGSTDNTPEILNEYAAKDARFRILQQPNSGAGIARNYGRTFATGDYIIFLDSDDIYEPEMLEKLYRIAVKENLDIAVCRSDRIDTNTGEHIVCNWTIKDKLLPDHKPFSSREIEQNFFMVFVWWPWDKLYKKAFIDTLELEFQDLRTTNDLYFVAGSVLKAERISYIDDVLVHHRVGMGDSLSVTREKSWNCFFYALLQLRRFMQKEQMYQRLEKDFVNYCLHFALWQLESLHGYSYCLLYKALHDEWFDILTVKNHTAGYFYDKKLFEKMKKIVTIDLEHHMMERIWKLEKETGLTAAVDIDHYMAEQVWELEKRAETLKNN